MLLCAPLWKPEFRLPVNLWRQQHQSLVPLSVFTLCMCTFNRFTLIFNNYYMISNVYIEHFPTFSVTSIFHPVTSDLTHGLKDNRIQKQCMKTSNKRYLFSCASYLIPSNLASNNRMNFCWITGGRHMEGCSCLHKQMETN